MLEERHKVELSKEVKKSAEFEQSTEKHDSKRTFPSFRSTFEIFSYLIV